MSTDASSIHHVTTTASAATQSNYPSESDLLQVCLLGKFYEPTHTHYNTNNSSTAIVTCNRCLRTHLECAYGYQNLDLCTSCYKDIQLSRYSGLSTATNKSNKSTSSAYRCETVTLMRTSSTNCIIG